MNRQSSKNGMTGVRLPEELDTQVTMRCRAPAGASWLPSLRPVRRVGEFASLAASKSESTSENKLKRNPHTVI